MDAGQTEVTFLMPNRAMRARFGPDRPQLVCCATVPSPGYEISPDRQWVRAARVKARGATSDELVARVAMPNMDGGIGAWIIIDGTIDRIVQSWWGNRVTIRDFTTSVELAK